MMISIAPFVLTVLVAIHFGIHDAESFSLSFPRGIRVHPIVVTPSSSFSTSTTATTTTTTSLKADNRKPNSSFTLPDVDFSSIQNPFNEFDIGRLQDGIADFDINQVVSNVKGSANEELGSRGEIYFIAQAALIVFIVIGGLPVIGDPLWAMYV
jgi:hypothetical protein